MTSSLPSSFHSKKQKILSHLAVPDSEYDDLSPKGSVDVGIRELIDEINTLEGCVTTSSCAGRISVFLEGRKKTSDDQKGGRNQERDDEEDAGEDGERMTTVAGVGGKGGGGRWLFVSHDPVELKAVDGELAGLFGMMREEEGVLERRCGGTRDRRFIHFKFEPMVSLPITPIYISY